MPELSSEYLTDVNELIKEGLKHKEVTPEAKEAIEKWCESLLEDDKEEFERSIRRYLLSLHNLPEDSSRNVSSALLANYLESIDDLYKRYSGDVQLASHHLWNCWSFSR